MLITTCLIVLALAFAGLQATAANAQSEQQKLVNQANTTLTNFLRDPDMTWLQQNIGRAKAVLISPSIVTISMPMTLLVVSPYLRQ